MNRLRADDERTGGASVNAGASEVPVILGPTAAGKSSLALAIARRIGGVEIISADSRQIYTGMDVGTAKPSAAEQAEIPHHLIDITTPDHAFSAGAFADRARAVLDDVAARGGRALVVGGSGFYIRALFEGLAAPKVDQEVLDRLAERGDREGYDVLYAELERIDPVAAHAHAPQNHVKTLRALCCYHQTGMLYSDYLAGAGNDGARYRPRYIGIAPPRRELYAHINARALAMIDAGLLDEVRGLLANGYAADAPGLRTVGYAEALRFIGGELDHAAMAELMQQSTRRYAKRQMTWFRRVAGVEWMEEPDVERALEWMRW